MLGLLSVGDYNALLYLALNASNPLNVTLVGSSTPVWMLLIGCYFFGLSISQRQGMGAALSILGVLVVLCRGQLELLLQVHLVTGDLYILLASFAWAYNSRVLARPTTEPASIRADWSAFCWRKWLSVWLGRPCLPAANGLWAVLIARIYQVFPLLRPLCGGQMRLIAFITHSADIRQILEHPGADSEPPHLSPARGPPLWGDDTTRSRPRGGPARQWGTQ